MEMQPNLYVMSSCAWALVRAERSLLGSDGWRAVRNQRMYISG